MWKSQGIKTTDKDGNALSDWRIKPPNHKNDKICVTCDICGDILKNDGNGKDWTNNTKHYYNNGVSTKCTTPTAHLDVWVEMHPEAQAKLAKEGYGWTGKAAFLASPHASAASGAMVGEGAPVVRSKDHGISNSRDQPLITTHAVKREHPGDADRPLSNEEQRLLELKLARFIISTGQAFSFCRKDTRVGSEFAAFVNLLDPRFKVPGIKQLKKLVMEMYDATKELQRRVLECGMLGQSAKKNGGMVLSGQTDVWSGYNNRNCLMNLDVSFVLATEHFKYFEDQEGWGKFPHKEGWRKGDVEVIKMNITTEELSGSHGGAEMACFVAQALGKVGIRQSLEGEAEELFHMTLTEKHRSELQRTEASDGKCTALQNLTTDSAAAALCISKGLYGTSSVKCMAHLVATCVNKGVKKKKKKDGKKKDSPQQATTLKQALEQVCLSDPPYSLSLSPS